MEAPDPSWQRLKPLLRSLAADRRRPLRSYPDPAVDQDRSPPFRIGLAAWAVEQAAGLHARFGADLALTVGTLAYPPAGGRRRGADGGPPPVPPRSDEPLLDPNTVTVGPEGTLEVASGHSLRAAVLCSNRVGEPVELVSTGVVLAAVVDPADRRAVGGYEGALTLARVTHRIEPGTTVRVPLLVGTASLVPELGYAVPPGRWAVEAVIELVGRGRFRTPLVPILVTD